MTALEGTRLHKFVIGSPSALDHEIRLAVTIAAEISESFGLSDDRIKCNDSEEAKLI